MKRVKTFLRRLLPVRNTGEVNLVADDVTATALADDIKAAAAPEDVAEDVRSEPADDSSDEGDGDEDDAGDDNESLTSSDTSTKSPDDTSRPQVPGWPSTYNPDSHVRIHRLSRSSLSGVRGLVGVEGVLKVDNAQHDRRPAPHRRLSAEFSGRPETDGRVCCPRGVLGGVCCVSRAGVTFGASSPFQGESQPKKVSNVATSVEPNMRQEVVKSDKSGPSVGLRKSGSTKTHPRQSPRPAIGAQGKGKATHDTRRSNTIAGKVNASAKQTNRGDRAPARVVRRGNAGLKRNPISGLSSHRMQTQTSPVNLAIGVHSPKSRRSLVPDMGSHVMVCSGSFVCSANSLAVCNTQSKNTASCQTGVTIPLKSILKTTKSGRLYEEIPNTTSNASCQAEVIRKANSGSAKSWPTLIRFPSKMATPPTPLSEVGDDRNKPSLPSTTGIEQGRWSTSMPDLPSNSNSLASSDHFELPAAKDTEMPSCIAFESCSDDEKTTSGHNGDIQNVTFIKSCDDVEVQNQLFPDAKGHGEEYFVAEKCDVEPASLLTNRSVTERGVSPLNIFSASALRPPLQANSARKILIHCNTCSTTCEPAVSKIRTYVQSTPQEGEIGLILMSEAPAVSTSCESIDSNMANISVVSKGVETVCLMSCVSWAHIPHRLMLTDIHGSPVPGARLEFNPHSFLNAHSHEQMIGARKGTEKKVSFCSAHPLFSVMESLPTTQLREEAVEGEAKMNVRTLAAAAVQGMCRSAKESQMCTASYAAVQNIALEFEAPWEECSYSILAADESCQPSLVNTGGVYSTCSTMISDYFPRDYSPNEFTQKENNTTSKGVQVELKEPVKVDSSSSPRFKHSKIIVSDSRNSEVKVHAFESDGMVAKTYKAAIDEIISQPNILPDPMSTDSMDVPCKGHVKVPTPPQIQGTFANNSLYDSLEDAAKQAAKESTASVTCRARPLSMGLPSDESAHGVSTSSKNKDQEDKPVVIMKRRGLHKQAKENERGRLVMTRRGQVRKSHEPRRGTTYSGAHRTAKHSNPRVMQRKALDHRSSAKRHLHTDLSAHTIDNEVQSLWISPWTKQAHSSSKSILDVSGEGSNLVCNSKDTDSLQDTLDENDLLQEGAEDASPRTADTSPDAESLQVSSDSDEREEEHEQDHEHQDIKWSREPTGTSWTRKGALGKIVGRAKDAARSRVPFNFKNRGRLASTDPNVAVFECAVCTDYLSPPLRRCFEGHGLCTRCYKGDEDCPVCGKEVPFETNKALNNLIRTITFPCKNSVAGCKEVYFIEERARHESSCAYRPRPCPFSSRSQVMCPWSGLRNMIRAHMKRMHGHHGIVYSYKTFFPMEDFNVSAWAARTYHVEIVFVEHEIFELHKVFDKRNTCLWGLLRHILAKDASAQFCYTIRFQPVNMRPSVSFRNDAVNGTEDLDQAFNQGKRFNLHLDCFTQTPLDIFTVQLKVQPREKNKWT